MLNAKMVEEDWKIVNTTRIMQACSAGHYALVKMLIAHGEDVNATSTVTYGSPIEKPELGIATKMPSMLFSGGNSPLMFAAAQGYLNIGEALLDAGAEIDLRNEKGLTALMLSVYYGHFNMMQFLVMKGANVNLSLRDGHASILKIAAIQGKLDCLKFICDVADYTTYDLSNALLDASINGHTEVAKFLVHLGAPLNSPDNHYDSALMLAVSVCDIDMVSFYLENGADINYITDLGCSALIEAVNTGNLNMVEFLVLSGADINPDSDETALGMACRNGFADIVGYLLLFGADPLLGTPTPLSLAVVSRRLNLIPLLIHSGARY